MGVVSLGERIVGVLVALAGFEATSDHLTAVLNIEDMAARTFWTVAGESPASVAASRTAWTMRRTNELKPHPADEGQNPLMQ
ncbi:MAG TPA: hypothetical protein VKI01_10000 [Acidimicrobiia bacterium]|nr:hypothetical protein [Acidimicrobiia bacterium]